MKHTYYFNIADQISYLTPESEEVIIFFHGLGATNTDLIPMFEMIKNKLPDSSKIGGFFVQAPTQPCKLFGGQVLPCWFDVESLEDLLSNKWIGLIDIVQGLLKMISDIKSLYPNIKKLSLAGFSQGGVIAQKISENISCHHLILMSTFAARPINPIHAHKCFIAHGLLDQVVNIIYGRELHQAIEQRAREDSFLCTYHEYTFMDHNICPEEINDIVSFIQS